MNSAREHTHYSIVRPTRRLKATIWRALQTFARIDGGQWAGAFAFSAFFSFFPLIILLVTVLSFFIDRLDATRDIISYLEIYVPMSAEWQKYIAETITGVVNARTQAGLIAFLMLVWSTLQSFSTLITATNHAWGTEQQNWWRLPLRSLTILGVTGTAILLGVSAPVCLKIVSLFFPPLEQLMLWLTQIATFFIPLLVMFFGLVTFYKLAPKRPTRFSEVWLPALTITLLLLGSENLFLIYLNTFVKSNAIYGSFTGIMGLLMWIYLAGMFFIFGACLASSSAAIKLELELDTR